MILANLCGAMLTMLIVIGLAKNDRARYKEMTGQWRHFWPSSLISMSQISCFKCYDSFQAGEWSSGEKAKYRNSKKKNSDADSCSKQEYLFNMIKQ